MPALLARRDGHAPLLEQRDRVSGRSCRRPATASRDSDELERERHFGAHQHQRPQLASARTCSARKIIGGIPTPPPSASRRGRADRP